VPCEDNGVSASFNNSSDILADIVDTLLVRFLGLCIGGESSVSDIFSFLNELFDAELGLVRLLLGVNTGDVSIISITDWVDEHKVSVKLSAFLVFLTG
jgi:hypothetical protein